MDAQFVHEALGEYGQPGLHEATSLVGFRPMTGYCSRSRTEPLISTDSSERKYTAAQATSSGDSRRPDGAKVAGSIAGQSSGRPSFAFSTRSFGVSVQPTFS